MKIKALLIGVLLSTPATAANIPWFESNSPLTQAHRYLLNDDLPAMFSSLVEVWQQEKNRAISPHLNELFQQSLQVDCGKGLDSKPLPDWIKGVTVRAIETQSPGRDSYRALIEVASRKDVTDISLTRWVQKSISTDNSFVALAENEDEVKSYVKRYNLNSKIPMGLYRLDVTAKDQTSWSSWLVFGEPKAKVSIRWQSKDQWRVERNALLNSHCPLPKLDTALYDYVDGQYNKVWGATYESDYPTALEPNPVDPGRYVLAVSMTHQRWQGPIIVEQSQIISKTYDVSIEE
ncbi:DUF2861 family protein [Vibrio coralliilyticus]|uniref:DUF2861 family protein n=1 Tax=Vibrio coralliilyticus TaxID=190893 RepID=UPI00148E5BE3|nr:DUF2861 family protein [Vibrio coralliilyticus]NOI29764.1 DUF2861 family protein [Vibrio coralliilyticus]NOI48578.1 DUF2861 family protein [Vibrio coralliilyticus]